MDAIMKLEEDIRPKLDCTTKQTWATRPDGPFPDILGKIDDVVEILEGLL